MFLKRATRDRLNVFRAYSENDATITQIKRRLLHGEKRFPTGSPLPDSETFEAVVTDDAAPDGVIEIERKALARLAPDRTQQTPQNIGIDGETIGRER